MLRSLKVVFIAIHEDSLPDDKTARIVSTFPLGCAHDSCLQSRQKFYLYPLHSVVVFAVGYASAVPFPLQDRYSANDHASRGTVPHLIMCKLCEPSTAGRQTPCSTRILLIFRVSREVPLTPTRLSLRSIVVKSWGEDHARWWRMKNPITSWGSTCFVDEGAVVPQTHLHRGGISTPVFTHAESTLHAMLVCLWVWL